MHCSSLNQSLGQQWLQNHRFPPISLFTFCTLTKGFKPCSFPTFTMCLLVYVCFLGSLLQINRGTTAGVSELLRFQRGVPDSKWRYAGSSNFYSRRRLPGTNFPYSLFNLLTYSYQFILFAYRHIYIYILMQHKEN